MKNFEDMQFTEKIELVKRASMGVPKIINIDLGAVLIDQPYDIAGNVFYIFSAPGEGDYIGIKVNETREPMINYSGTIQIIDGTEAPDMMEILDHRATTVAGVGGILDELRGDLVHENWGTEITVTNAAAIQILPVNAARKGCIIQAKSTNTGIVYIGFDNSVTTTKWMAELQAGMTFTIDDYRGDFYGRADAAGQLVGWGEW